MEIVNGIHVNGDAPFSQFLTRFFRLKGQKIEFFFLLVQYELHGRIAENAIPVVEYYRVVCVCSAQVKWLNLRSKFT